MIRLRANGKWLGAKGFLGRVKDIPLALLPLSFALIFLASCASKEPTPGYYKVGKPYQVEGKWYEPKQQADYDEVGMASWYGSEFHKKETANGGKFDKNVLSAAHKTLPLPSMVKVTNLDNNKTLIVMVNDRGPFSNNRILDVSERAAEILGFKNKGVTKVRVQYLPGQTKRLLSELPGIKSEKQAQEKAFGNSKTAKLDVASTPMATTPVNQLSRVFTSAASESEIKEAPFTVADNSAINTSVDKAEVKTPAAKVKKSDVPTDNDEAASDVTPVVAGKVEEISKDVQYIQAGTYGVKGNAERVEKALAPIGDVSIVPVKVNGKLLYKVKVGPILDKKIAELSLKKVITLGHPDALLVSK